MPRLAGAAWFALTGSRGGLGGCWQARFDGADGAGSELSLSGRLASFDGAARPRALGAVGTADLASVILAGIAVVLVPLLLAEPAESAGGMNYCPHNPTVPAACGLRC